MANGYDPGAFDVIREEYVDRRERPERPLPDRDLPEREREDDRDRDEARLADDLQRELDKLPEIQQEEAYLDLREMAGEMEDQRLENALAKIAADVPRDFSDRRRRRSVGRQTIRRSNQFRRDRILPSIRTPAKKKRKVSKYQKEFGKQLKKLVKKHPRTKVTKLMKRAHTATRKAMK
jgi:hypothetical protein